MSSASRSLLNKLPKIILINATVLMAVLLIIELLFGRWFGQFEVDDLRRFSIPIGVSYQYDVSSLYDSGAGPIIHYSRDRWGLRGFHRALSDIEVLTIGGSTTDQRFLDDAETWQAFAEQELARRGHPMVIANAGIDGQSTVGHLFNFKYWFPLLEDLKPKYVLFYIGINDVLRKSRRRQFDAKVDPSGWRVRSALWQLVRTVRGNLSARSLNVNHGRKPTLGDSDFTIGGLLGSDERTQLANELTSSFMTNVEELERAATALGALPVFVTQTAFAWQGGLKTEPRGLKHIIWLDRKMNYADVSFLHQRMNKQLLDHCRVHSLTCIDLASELRFEATDYYDYVHLTPVGSAKVGRYLASKLVLLADDRSSSEGIIANSGAR